MDNISKTTCLIAITLFCFSCTTFKSRNTDHSEQKEKEQLRVLSYNMHYANPPSKPGIIDLDAIAEVIKTANPDIVALQEVDVNVKRSGNIDEVALLARKTGLKAYYFSKAIDHDGGDYGVAILSKFEILESKTYKLPHDSETNPEPRVMGTVRVQTENGFEFIFANTHLEVRHEVNRLMQLKAIGEIFHETNLPIIIAGDFNALPGSETINYLDEIFTRTCEDCPPTIPVIEPKRAIDFIAYRSENHFKKVFHEVIDEKYASDHLPVFAILEIQ